MRPISRWTSFAGLAVGIAVFAAACSASATPSATVAAAMATPTAAASVAATPTTAAVDTSSAAPSAAAGLTIGSTTNATLGDYLTGLNGMTLYVYTKDTADTSTCSGTCATNWPPLTVASGATVTGPSAATMGFATITRADGTTQVTYNHMPLYYFAGDSAAGDTNGQGKGGVWSVAPVSATVTGY